MARINHSIQALESFYNTFHWKHKISFRKSSQQGVNLYFYFFIQLVSSYHQIILVHSFLSFKLLFYILLSSVDEMFCIRKKIAVVFVLIPSKQLFSVDLTSEFVQNNFYVDSLIVFILFAFFILKFDYCLPDHLLLSFVAIKLRLLLLPCHAMQSNWIHHMIFVTVRQNAW